MNILEEIAEKTKIRVEESKQKRPLEEVKREALALSADTGFPFEKALAKEGVSFICEVKKASPSKGLIADKFPYVEIAKTYEQSGASAISVLTEPYYFQGSDNFLEEIHKQVSLPLLRKDFIVDEYMIYEAKLLGASAVLLICAILDEDQLKDYIEKAHKLGLTALTEAHDEEEIKKAIRAGARVIGVNNRDLKTFTVDIKNSIRLRKLVPDDILFVSESGIRTADDIRELAENKVNAALIGETLMRAGNVKEVLAEMKEAGKKKAIASAAE
ncbi:MAG: indole-3-glycerol phosphate synthase TrpC [Butyribacter sp.]|nr:indole-3-glycerol phosphate synthase TrpC [bacterium]MDY3854163.1 indole-3-glycerol phosphate synthase TrpC [Butyribacter sp.]